MNANIMYCITIYLYFFYRYLNIYPDDRNLGRSYCDILFIDRIFIRHTSISYIFNVERI